MEWNGMETNANNNGTWHHATARPQRQPNDQQQRTRSTQQ
jgi:hypothetical protein